METARTLISDALQELLVNASEQPIEAVEFETAKRYLNRMMAEFAADGINLGYREVTNPSDPITVPSGAINGMIYNLALKLAASYDVEVNPVLAVNADSGERVMSRIANQIQPSSYPDTLPIGSGNEGDTTDGYVFYNGDPDTVNTELNQVIGVEK